MNRLALLPACALLLACASHKSAPEAEVPVVHPSISYIDRASFSMAVPTSWTVRDGFAGEDSIHRVGDGIGLPAVDEGGAPLELGLMVERMGGSDLSTAVELLRKELVRAHGDATVRDEAVALCGGREGVLLTADFAAGGRHTLNQTLVGVDAEGAPWKANIYIHTGPQSRLSTAGGELAPTLRPWLLTFCGQPGTHHSAPLRPLLGESVDG